MSPPTQKNPFAASALKFAEAGCAVLPCGGDNGKEPLVNGWNKWTGPTSHGGVDRLRGKFPLANIGLVCGRASNLTVVDVDNSSLLEEALQCFGETYLKAKSPRTAGGFHLYYRHNGERGRSFPGLDIKATGGYIVAPPSFNKNIGRGYSWVEGSGSTKDFEKLTTIRHNAVKEWQSQYSDNASSTKLQLSNEGNRNNELFAVLLREVGDWDLGQKAFLAHAQKRNSEVCRPPLPDGEVTNIALSAWRYREKGNNWCGSSEQRLVLLASDFEAVKGDADAWLLLTVLIKYHKGCHDEFCISPKSMAEHQVIPRWGPARYRSARDKLVEAGLIEQVHKGGSRPGDPDRFKFAAKGSATEPNTNKQPLT